MELIFATILKIDFPDLKSIISQEIMHDIRRIIENKELEYLPIIFQELFLIPDSSPPQSMFSVFLHIIVSHRDELDIGLFKELVLRLIIALLLINSYIVIEFSSVVIAIRNMDILPIDVDTLAYGEVFRSNQKSTAISIHYFPPH